MAVVLLVYGLVKALKGPSRCAQVKVHLVRESRYTCWYVCKFLFWTGKCGSVYGNEESGEERQHVGGSGEDST